MRTSSGRREIGVIGAEVRCSLQQFPTMVIFCADQNVVFHRQRIERIGELG